MVKNLPANAEKIIEDGWVLGSGRTLEEGMAIHSSNFAWRIPWTEEPAGGGGYSLWGRKESDRSEQLTLSLFTTMAL